MEDSLFGSDFACTYAQNAINAISGVTTHSDLGPRYHIGDSVKIIDRIHDSNDYPFSFTDAMAQLSGNVYEIVDITKMNEPTKDESKSKRCYNGDPYRYTLRTGQHNYAWHSSMFELPTTASVESWLWEPYFERDYFSEEPQKEIIKIKRHHIKIFN